MLFPKKMPFFTRKTANFVAFLLACKGAAACLLEFLKRRRGRLENLRRRRRRMVGSGGLLMTNLSVSSSSSSFLCVICIWLVERTWGKRSNYSESQVRILHVYRIVPWLWCIFFAQGHGFHGGIQEKMWQILFYEKSMQLLAEWTRAVLLCSLWKKENLFFSGKERLCDFPTFYGNKKWIVQADWQLENKQHPQTNLSWKVSFVTKRWISAFRNPQTNSNQPAKREEGGREK